MAKIPDEDLTDYQRGRIAELVRAGCKVVGSIYGMPTIESGRGVFALTPLPPPKSSRRKPPKEFLYVTPIEREWIG